MGLDMYLRGRKTKYHSKYDKVVPPMPKEDGFEVVYTHKDLELGYWRKHANLHGFIVQEFADGVDECQEIKLGEKDLKKIIEAVKSPERLPHTTGFFFGASSGDEKEVAEDLRIFTRALEWLENESEEYRSVFYRASW